MITPYCWSVAEPFDDDDTKPVCAYIFYNFWHLSSVA